MTLKEYIKNPDLFKWNGKEEVDLRVLRKDGLPFTAIDGTIYESYNCDFIDYDFAPDQVFAEWYSCEFIKEVVSCDMVRTILIKLP